MLAHCIQIEGMKEAWATPEGLTGYTGSTII